MSVGFLFLMIFVTLVVVFGGVTVVGYLSNSSRQELAGVKRQLSVTQQRARVAERTLRSIANDAGQPALEAQLALDEIEATYMKELS